MIFKSRKYRAYFELLDACGDQGCSLCRLLTGKAKEAVARLIARVGQGERSAALLSNLCPFHRVKSKEILHDDPQTVNVLKQVLREKCRELADVPAESSSPWRWRLRNRSRTAICPLCQEAQSQEKLYCRAVVRFLDDIDFWRRFQMASPLCLDHLRRCLAVGNGGKGLSRLLQNEMSKLDALLDELIHFEATGLDRESKTKALEWLVDKKKEPVPYSPYASVADQEEVLDPEAEDCPRNDGNVPDPEELLFENEQLKRKVEELLQLFNKAETRAASLHYRLADLSEVNKRLEMGYTGANALASGLEKMVQDLRREIEKLKEEKPSSSPKQIT